MFKLLFSAKIALIFAHHSGKYTNKTQIKHKKNLI